MARFKSYYLLTKPGIIYGNDIAAIAGFLFASRFPFSPVLFIMTIGGLSCVIASACVFNNFLDRGIDEKMERTKKRALVTKEIATSQALSFGALLGLIGFGTLWLFTNPLTTLVAFAGWFLYIVAYGYAKRTSVYSTLIGAIPGAVPPIVGYTAVTHQFDIRALLLFLILVSWQMPHFYAIAVYRLKDYANAGLPVLPVKQGIPTTKLHMLFWMLVFSIVAISFTLLKITGYIFLVVLVLLCGNWLFLALKGFWAKDDGKWARKVFGFSLLTLLVTCLMLSVGRLLP